MDTINIPDCKFSRFFETGGMEAFLPERCFNETFFRISKRFCTMLFLLNESYPPSASFSQKNYIKISTNQNIQQIPNKIRLNRHKKILLKHHFVSSLHCETTNLLLRVVETNKENALTKEINHRTVFQLGKINCENYSVHSLNKYKTPPPPLPTNKQRDIRAGTLASHQ